MKVLIYIYMGENIIRYFLKGLQTLNSREKNGNYNCGIKKIDLVIS